MRRSIETKCSGTYSSIVQIIVHRCRDLRVCFELERFDIPFLPSSSFGGQRELIEVVHGGLCNDLIGTR